MTNQITAFDKSNLKEIRADINAALQAVMDKHGILLSFGNITYDPDGSNFRTRLQGNVKPKPLKKIEDIDFSKVKVTVIGNDPDLHAFAGTTPAAPTALNVTKLGNDTVDEALANAPFGPTHRWTLDFIRNCQRVNMTPADLGKPVTVYGKKMRIAGYTNNSPKGEIILATMGAKPRYMPVPKAVALAALGR